MREVHISGGVRVFSYNKSSNYLYPGDMGGEKTAIEVKAYGALFSKIKSLGLEIVGCDFFTHSITLPEWRSKASTGSAWLTWEQGRDWSFIAQGAFKSGDSRLYDIAARISHQLRSCEWRVRQLSESYMDQLNDKLKSGDFKSCQRFRDGYTEQCYLAVQAFFIDACTLRDYLVEFYWYVISKGDTRITSIGSLVKSWRKIPPIDLHGISIQEISAKGGWLDVLGNYRNLIIHAAPLAMAGKTLYAVAGILSLSNSVSLPFVKLPLPSDPERLKEERISGRYFDDPLLNRARLHNMIERDEALLAPDSLDYASSCLEKLSAWAASLAELSPVAAEIPLMIPIEGSFEIRK